MIGILADLANANRRLIEEVLLRVRRLELGARRKPPTRADRGSAAAPADTDTSASDRPE
jgi:hypothetical protein